MENGSGEKAYCHKCGKQIDPAEFCPYCGARQLNPSGGKSGSSSVEEYEAMKHFRLAAIILIIGTIGPFLYVIMSRFLGVVTTNTTNGINASMVSYSEIIVGVVLLFTIIFAVGMFFFAQAFDGLNAFSRGDYSFPRISAYILMALPFILVLILLLLIPESISTIGFIPAGSIVGFLIEIILAMFLISVITLIAIIGLIIGLWRVGTRYDSTLIHVGAIMMIIPFLAFIGTILIFVGSNEVVNHIKPISSGPMS